jgi:hypothetical protein
MTYAELKTLTEGKILPLVATNEHGENVIVDHRIDRWSYEDSAWERPNFIVTTAQHNGWTRINLIYEDGSSDELYQRSNK